MSIDGVGKTNEYIRNPSVWEVTLENLKKYYDIIDNKKHKCFLTNQISHTVSLYNVYYLTDFLNYMDTNFPKLNVWVNLVYFPEYLSVNNCPSKLREKTLEKLKTEKYPERYKSDVDSIINLLENSNVNNDKLINFTNLQDLYRNVIIDDFIPEIKELLC